MANKKITYTTEIDNSQSIKAMADMEKQIGKTSDSVEGFGETSKSSLGGIGDSLESMDNPLKNAIGGVKALGKQFLLLLANPIVLVIAGIAAVLTLLFKAFTRTEAGGNKLNKGMAILSGVMSALFKVIEPLASFIVDTVIVAFETLAEATAEAAEIVASAMELFGFDDAAKDIRDFTEATGGLIEETIKLADLQAELVKGRREQSLIEKQALIDAEKLRQVRDDESFSIEERKQANIELGQVLQKQLKDELSIAGKSLEAAQLRLKIDGETTEALDGLAEAQLELLDINERINGQQSEQLANLNSLRNEEKALAKERRDAYLNRVKQIEEENKKIRQLSTDSARIIRDITNQNLIEGTEKEIAIENAKWDDKIAAAKTKFGEESEVIKALESERRAATQAIEDANKAEDDERKRARAESERDLELELKLLKAEAGLPDEDATPEQLQEVYDAKVAIEDAQWIADQERIKEQFEEGLISETEFLTQKELAKVKHNEKIKELDKDVAKSEKAILDARLAAQFGFANAVTGIVSGLSALAEQGSAEAKVLALAEIAIGTGIGFIKGLTIAQKSAEATGPAAAYAFPLFYATQIGAVLSAAAQAKNILKSAPGGGGSGGGSTPSAPTIPLPPPLPPSIIEEPETAEGAETEEIGAGAGLRQQTIKAYVVETELTSTQNTISNIEQQSEIG